MALVLLLAATARAQDVDWSGTWSVDGGGTAAVGVQGGEYTLLASVTTPSIRTQDVALVGTATGADLRLDGTLTITSGFVGALGGGGKILPGVPCSLLAHEQDQGANQIADVQYWTNGSLIRTETWQRTRPLIEILGLASNGAPLAGAFDAKLSTTGLVVRYRLNGSETRALRLTVTVDPAHELYTGFYTTPLIREKSEGQVAPGVHAAGWDGRDGTPAARIALEGGYTLRLEAEDGEGASRSVVLAGPRFVFVGANSPPGLGRLSSPTLRGRALNALAETKGFGSQDATPSYAPNDALAVLPDAATCIVNAHGVPGGIVFRDETAAGGAGATTILAGSVVEGIDLRDLHWAVLTCCHSGLSDPISANGTKSMTDAFVAAGCDFAIGFNKYVRVTFGENFQEEILKLLERGSTIGKAARQAARNALRAEFPENHIPDAKLDAFMADEKSSKVEADLTVFGGLTFSTGPGITEDEPYWPPRYGNSRN
jgi:hypothetical protein